MKKLKLLALSLALLASACSSVDTSESKSQKGNTGKASAAHPQTSQDGQGKDASLCDPNYSGCVPVASDVDCAGGGGNGPAFVEGPVTVIGRDIYELDRDGNGIGCEERTK